MLGNIGKVEFLFNSDRRIIKMIALILNTLFMWEKIQDIWWEKQQTIKLGVMLLSVVILAIVVGWLMFFNKANIVVTGETPFQISLSSGANEVCNSSPCEVPVKAGNYQMVVSKSGYENQTFNFTLKNGEEKKIAVEMVFAPTIDLISQLTNSVVITGDLRLIKTWNLFGDQSILISLVDLINTSGTKIFAIDNTNSHIYFLGIDETVNKSYLFKTESSLKDQEKITTFARPISEGLMIISPEGNQAIMVDNSIKGKDTLYLIDLINGEKQRISELKNLRGIKWLDQDKLLISIVTATGMEIYLTNADGSESNKLEVAFEIDNAVLKGQEIWFATINEKLVGVEINKLNLDNQEVQKIVDLSKNLKSSQKIELSRDGKKLRILSDWKLYEVGIAAD